MHAGYLPPAMRRGGPEQALPVLVDPMCGSAPIAIEAALIAGDVAPGLGRAPTAEAWPFLRWGDASPDAFRGVLDDALARAEYGERELLPRAQIAAIDVHPAAVAIAERDSASARVREHIALSNDDAAFWSPPGKPQLVVTNPPWGGAEARLEGDTQLAWEALSAFLKREMSEDGGDCWALSGDPTATKHLRLRAERKQPLVVGGVDCRLLHYRIFAQSERELAASRRDAHGS